MDGMYNRSRKATFSNFSVQSSEVYTAAEIIHYFSVKIAVSLPIKHEILRLTTFANTEKRMDTYHTNSGSPTVTACPVGSG